MSMGPQWKQSPSLHGIKNIGQDRKEQIDCSGQFCKELKLVVSIA